VGFTKLDEGIVFSSIMGEDDSVFRAWIILLATCKEDGISRISEVFLCSIMKKDLNEIQRCLKVLESPDSNSRSKNDDGKRIIRIDGGFKIINYQRYRENTPTDYLREKQRKYRYKKDGIDTVEIPSASLLVSSSKEEEVQEKGKKKFYKPTIEEITEYCKSRSNSVDTQRFFDYYESKGWMVGKSPMKNWQAAVRTWEKNNFNSSPKPKKPQFSGIPDDYYKKTQKVLLPDGSDFHPENNKWEPGFKATLIRPTCSLRTPF